MHLLLLPNLYDDRSSDNKRVEPEGVLFISVEEIPNGKPLLIVSSEDDGFLRIYQND